MMEVLWAGWRTTYVTGLGGDHEGDRCLFCELPDSGPDNETYVVERGESVYSVLNLYPYTNGHILVTPYRHVAKPEELTPEEVSELWAVVVSSQQALDGAMSPHGYNLGANLGRDGGAGVLGHFHLHVVPRWQGDTSFMTAVGATRVLPQTLDDTWTQLRELVRS